MIRSFVRRESRFTQGQQLAFKNYWSLYGIEPPEGLLDLAGVFNNTQPTILDIGFGNGEALLALAKQYSELNFLGVEVHRSGIGALLKGVAEAELNNVRVINMDAVTLLYEHIATEFLSAVFIWFPDPWSKRRHHKRRMIQTEFVQLVASKLVSDGELNIATDWQHYACHIQKILDSSELFKKITASNLIQQRPNTKFERRGKRLGHQVFDQVYKKVR